MKRIVILFAFVLLMGLLATNVQADPAVISMFPGEGRCNIGWPSSTAPSGFVLFPGEGLSIETNNASGDKILRCRGQVDFGATVQARDFGTRVEGEYVLLTFEQTCNLLPDICNGNGAAVANSSNVPLKCFSGDRLTTDWQEIVTTSGRASIVCKFRG